MSSLLKEAIVDAKALRESALKNAETSIIEKYSEEVKETLDKLLEQDEMATDASPTSSTDVVENVPLAATDDLSEEEGDIPQEMSKEGEEVPVTIDLDALQEAIKSLENELNEEETIEINEEDLAAILSEDDEDVIEEDDSDSDDHDDEDPSAGYAAETDDTAAKAEASAAQDEEAMKGMEENTDIDSLVDDIMEKLTVDMEADLAGWAGRSSKDVTHEIERELAHRRSTDVEEELKTLKKAQEELVFENKQLNEHLKQHKQVVDELKESLQDVNLSNARLLYTNRVLRNTSLNERQKQKLAEAISNAGSVTEAKVIFETLQSTVETKPKRSPQSLSEAIGNKRSSVIRATRTESTPSDPLSERMKRLAGIK